MDCNNILTDSQLEAMFATIEEEMRQIKQPIECPIERTQHKCKKCFRFLSNEATLKKHHCKPPIKKEKCSRCTHYCKAINRVNNLEKHLRSSEKAPAKWQLR